MAKVHSALLLHFPNFFFVYNEQAPNFGGLKAGSGEWHELHFTFQTFTYHLHDLPYHVSSFFKFNLSLALRVCPASIPPFFLVTEPQICKEDNLFFTGYTRLYHVRRLPSP